jgi:hypothetical protein
MAAAPLSAYERATPELDGQAQHPGRQAEVVRLSISWLRYSHGMRNEL